MKGNRTWLNTKARMARVVFHPAAAGTPAAKAPPTARSKYVITAMGVLFCGYVVWRESDRITAAPAPQQVVATMPAAIPELVPTLKVVETPRVSAHIVHFIGDHLFECIDMELESKAELDQLVAQIKKPLKGETNVSVPRKCEEQVTDRNARATCTIKGPKGSMISYFYDAATLRDDQQMRGCLGQRGDWHAIDSQLGVQFNNRRQELTEALDQSLKVLKGQ
jgi:hypothetical protein